MPSNSPDAAYKGVFARMTLYPQARVNGGNPGIAVDTAERGGADTVVGFVFTGVVTDGSHAVTVEESADGSTGWTAVPGSRIQGSLPTATAPDDTKVFEFGVATSLRYLRMVSTVSGATTGGIYTGGFVITGSHYEAH